MKTQCSVRLIHNTPLHVCSDAIRTCWQSGDKSDSGGPVDKALIDRVGNKMKHASTLEHLSYNFYVSGISRALLQELSRHRMASLSVKSTRYTLKELKEEPSFTSYDCPYGYEDSLERASKYLVWTYHPFVDSKSIQALENLRLVLVAGVSNDYAKYCLPEAYKTELTWTINARSLQNFIALRTDKAALWEIRELANAVFNALPEEHKYLFAECVKTYAPLD